MEEYIYNPVKEYDSKYRDKFRDVCKDTFQELADASHVDVEANRRLCKEINALKGELDKVSGRLSWMWMLCLALFAAVAAAVLAVFNDTVFGEYRYWVIGAGVAALALALFAVIPKIRSLRGRKGELEAAIKAKKGEAWRQMEPLNQLYDWDLFARMMSKTLPRIEFDPFFTTKRLADLVRTYQWDESFNTGRSIIYSHSGLINGNPFVICRTRKMVMGSKTYTGSKVIHWSAVERGSDGKMHTVHRSQTLTAEVTMPFPEHPEKTWLIYGNTAAPALVFNRTKNTFKHSVGSLSFKWKKWRLERKSRDLDKDYSMGMNEEFEVLFTASDRNDNQQFFLLFTPLAQESMVDLLRDEKHGYGDDFDFHKDNKINIIVADHMQELSLDMNPRQFRHFDFDEAQKLFTGTNARYFRSIYFCLAPLLCVPLYQHMRPLSDIYGREMPTESSYWEHEALANFWGDKHFQHPDCKTANILKTRATRSGDGHVRVDVEAQGYGYVVKIAYISKFGGDGRWHKVPVEYREYYPVTGNGVMSLREELDTCEEQMDAVSRKEFISRKLEEVRGGKGIYRRHTVSSIG